MPDRKNQEEQLRLFARNAQLKGTLPGKLFLPSTQEYLRGRALDVSKHGMCVLIDRTLKEGLIVWLILEDRYLKLEVANCNASRKEKNLFRCGLSLSDSHENLIELFHHFGCLAQNYLPKATG